MAGAEVDNAFYDSLGDRWYHDEEHVIALLRQESEARLGFVERGLADAPPETKILDVGCGAGFLSNPLGRTYQVTGIDQSASSLAVAERHRPEGSQVTYLAGDAYQLPFSDQTFDVVMAMDILEHLADPRACVREMARVLRPGGKIFFHTFNRTPEAALLAAWALEVWFRGPRNLHVASWFIKPHELRGWLSRIGCQVECMVGLRPVINAALLQAVVRRRLGPGIQFTESASLRVGYMGYATRGLLSGCAAEISSSPSGT